MRVSSMESPKYNRTLHFSFSKGATNDDKIALSANSLIGVPIVISEKIDGSNVSLEANGCYARTHAGPPTHKSFDEFKSLHASLKYNIDEGIQLYGEWALAVHSIYYDSLPAYYLLFNVRDLSNNIWSSWAEVEMWAKKVNVSTVPILFKGEVSSEKELKKLVESFMDRPSCYGDIREGIVARVARSFKDDEFSSCVLKCVRANHVTTDDHWKRKEIIKNKLKI